MKKGYLFSWVTVAFWGLKNWLYQGFKEWARNKQEKF